MDAAVWGLIGTLVGAVASIATSWLATRTSSRIQQEKLIDERHERARAFQRQTLLDLQEAVHDALRLVNRGYIEDYEANRSTKAWGKNMLSEEVNEGIRLAQRRVAMLVQRVADDDLRIQIKTLSGRTVQVILSKSEQEARLCLEQSTLEAERVFERLGVVLRLHY